VKFVVPHLYPVPTAPVYSVTEKEVHSLAPNDITTPSKPLASSSGTVSTTSIHLKRKKAKAPIVDTEVRRSERLKEINKGFKSSSYPSKNCFCCKIVPPTLSSKVIRSPGKDLCSIPLDDLSNEVLKKKPLEKKKASQLS
jgi:hypothetical protein